MQSQFISTLIVAILPLLFAITLHEAAHGYIACKLGDKTALMLGRVSLNPIRHIDPIGTIVVPLVMLFLSTGFIFGWAKPVPVTWQNLKNPRRDMALVAAAGPASNLLMAILWAAIAKIGYFLLGTWDHLYWGRVTALFLTKAGQFGILINILLLVLNLLPIPPLDGSRVVSALLPPRLAARYDLIEPYGFWILIALLLFGHLQRIIFPPTMAIAGAIAKLFSLPI